MENVFDMRRFGEDGNGNFLAMLSTSKSISLYDTLSIGACGCSQRIGFMD